MKILVLNSGSSSQKSALYEIGDALPEHPPAPLWQGKIEWSGDQAKFTVEKPQSAKVKEQIKVESRGGATAKLLDTLWSGKMRVVSDPSEVSVAGHRIVNGGQHFEQPTIVTPEVKAAIAEMAVFAPLHNRAELEGMEVVEKRFGSIPQVAVFDTGFHSQLPEAAHVYPGPYEWLAQGIRRYGFHGINYQYCLGRAAQLLGREVAGLRIVACHLGNGCSVAAIQNGRSVDTTMGFTPLEGLMMGTRAGTVDPGILTYLMRQGKFTGETLDDLLNSKSGLLGISGISGDMREIEAAMKAGHARAKLAFEIFAHRLQTGIGAMTAALGGIDVLVFTAGIGENSSAVRAAACGNLGHLGVKLDAEKNAKAVLDSDISAKDSGVRVLVIKAEEDWAIACDCWKLTSGREKR